MLQSTDGSETNTRQWQRETVRPIHLLPYRLDIDSWIAKYNKDHGIELPGAILPGGVEVDTILWEEGTARRNSVNGEGSQIVRGSPSNPANVKSS